MKEESIIPYRYIAILASAGIALFLIFYFLIPVLKPFAEYPLYVVLLLGGGPLIFMLLRKMLHLEFSSDLLAGISITTAVVLEQYLAGSLVVLMLSGGQALETYAIGTASKVLEKLAKRAPTVAHRKREDTLETIPVDQINIGDTLVILPHEICPVDGEVAEGRGVMDESYLTGEPFFLSKAPGSGVISGAINGDEALTIRAKKRAIDSRYAKIMEVMRESEQKRPRMRRLADQLGAWYTPLSVLIALIAWWMTGEAIRFLAVLVIATPCPLLIAIPVAIIGSISLSARCGILIKNPVVLEQLDQCRTMIFDKTGTLTYGKPVLTDQIVFDSRDPKEILQMAASIERYSKHPLSSAILEKAEEEKLNLLEVKHVSEPKGEGLRGRINGNEIILTSRKQLDRLGLYRNNLKNREFGKESAQILESGASDIVREQGASEDSKFGPKPTQPKTDSSGCLGINEKLKLLPKGIGLECMVLINGQLAAYYRFHDTPREEGTSFIGHLGPKHHIDRIMLVSGDREEEVKYMADTMGIKEVYSSQSPEQKVAIVEKERAKAKTAYLGDGINDAPALVVATVGIAFGQNSDVTAEAAGAVVMDNSLHTVEEFLHISRRMRVIALQSALGGIFLSLAGMIIAAFGYLPPVAGAISQEVIDVVVILNALRTAWRPKRFIDMP